MKIFLIIVLTITFFTKHAVCYSQTDKTVSFDVKNAAMNKIISIVKKQTQITFFYSASDIDSTRLITMKVIKMPVIKLMDSICHILSWRYNMTNNLITLYKEERVTRKDSITKTQAERITITGKITDQNGNALSGASIKVIGTNKGDIADEEGNFKLQVVVENAVLEISYVGYETSTIKIKEYGTDIRIQLIGAPADFPDLIIIARNGYRNIPKERATGSYGIIDSEQLSKTVNIDWEDMLRNKISGVTFHPNLMASSKEATFNIRGQSSILSSTAPLKLKDDFPYDGDPQNINTDDIATITVMKDAEASSIHGSRSGNGVINMITKKAKRNDPLRTELNINTTVSEKYDAFNDPGFINAGDYIDVEQFLFGKGFYDGALKDTFGRPALTPAVEIFAKRRTGSITAADSARQINELKSYDVRRDINKHYFQPMVNQQYSLAVSRGGPKGAICFLTGYRKNNSLLSRNGYQRLNIGFNNVFYPTTRLELQTSMFLTDSKTASNNAGLASVTMFNRKLYPYARLTDEDGSDAVVARELSQSYKNNSITPLSWNYLPLQDLRTANNTTRLNDILINVGARYFIYKGLRLEAKFQVEKQQTNNRNFQTEDQYFTRDLINKYFNPLLSGDKRFGIPRGTIFDETNTRLISVRSRFQLNVDTSFGRNNIAAVLGAEAGNVTNITSINRLYGYDPNKGTSSSLVDYKTPLPLFYNQNIKITIPNINEAETTKDISYSWYLNASWTYNHRYIFSASGRIDQANIFGSVFNKKNILLWSAGAAWKISKEDFYSLYWLPDLKLRVTYGCNGNVNRSVPALLSLNLLQANSLGLASASISNPDNPYLGWERSNTLNIAIDFGSIDHRITGTVEYYSKKADNLMEMHQVAPSAGLAGQGMHGYMANGAGMKGRGVDIEINSKNLTGIFKWTTRLLYNYNTNKIIHYSDTFPGATVVRSGGGLNVAVTPVAGKPLHYLYSYPWAGLDPKEGDPLGRIDNKITSDYNALTGLPINKLIENGPALPASTGVINNTFNYKKLSLSVNIAYRLGYYFRAPALSYYALFNTGTMNKDYAGRWQKPGDERTTNIPSLKYVTSPGRDAFYTNAAVSVYRADNVRFQDLKLAYEFHTRSWHSVPAGSIQLYFYMKNIAMLWTANKAGYDPDYISGYHPPRSYTIGVKADLK